MDEDAFNVLIAEGIDPATAYAASIEDTQMPAAGNRSARGVGLLIGVALVLAYTIWRACA